MILQHTSVIPIYSLNLFFGGKKKGNDSDKHFHELIRLVIQSHHGRPYQTPQC